MATDPTAAGPVTVPAAAYQPLPNPMTVVGPQFCAQYPVDLVIVKKMMTISDGNFAVTDVNGSVIFKVKGTLLSLRDHRVLLDAAGKPIVSLQSKVPSIISLFFLRIGTFFLQNTWRFDVSYWLIQMLSMHRRWQVFRGESSDPKDLLFSTKLSSIIQLKTGLDVFLAANTKEEICDFKLKGSWFDRSCTVYAGNSNTIIAQVRSKIISRQYYFNLTNFPPFFKGWFEFEIISKFFHS